MTIKTLRIATRSSRLALWQANYIKKLLNERDPTLQIELISITTTGDKDQTRALSEIGGKSLFVKELQQAILDGQADIAVHCIKDMSVQEHPDLNLAAILKREDPYDVFVSHQCSHIEMLKEGAIVGTASPRRQALIRNLYPTLQLKLLRGNLDTRLQKLKNGEYDALILAAAGLKRLGMTDSIQSHLNKEIFVPAIGQGAMGIECLKVRCDLHKLIKPLHHERTAACVIAERAVNKKLNGDCFTPLGAYAEIIDGILNLNAFVSSLNGNIIIRSHKTGPIEHPEALGLHVAQDLIEQGAMELLKDV